MARKKSIKRTAQVFIENAGDLYSFCEDMRLSVSDARLSWIFDYSIIRLYREFERLILEAIVGAINNDTSTLATTVGIDLPRHLTDDVCKYLVVRGGYFDFKGRDGLIKELKRYVPDSHYLTMAVRKERYKDSLEQLCALRNYAAHDSAQSKRAALKVTGGERIGSAGAWLKVQGRFATLHQRLSELAGEIQLSAPY